MCLRLAVFLDKGLSRLRWFQLADGLPLLVVKNSFGATSLILVLVDLATLFA